MVIQCLFHTKAGQSALSVVSPRFSSQIGAYLTKMQSGSG
jgi:hypothetical protein